MMANATCIQDEVWFGSETLKTLSLTDAVKGFFSFLGAATKSIETKTLDVEPKTAGKIISSIFYN